MGRIGGVHRRSEAVLGALQQREVERRTALRVRAGGVLAPWPGLVQQVIAEHHRVAGELVGDVRELARVRLLHPAAVEPEVVKRRRDRRREVVGGEAEVVPERDPVVVDRPAGEPVPGEHVAVHVLV